MYPSFESMFSLLLLMLPALICETCVLHVSVPTSEYTFSGHPLAFGSITMSEMLLISFAGDSPVTDRVASCQQGRVGVSVGVECGPM